MALALQCYQVGLNQFGLWQRVVQTKINPDFTDAQGNTGGRGKDIYDQGFIGFLRDLLDQSDAANTDLGVVAKVEKAPLQIKPSPQTLFHLF